jgi:pimeloyl-ACP methyl ester carboxylesterase
MLALAYAAAHPDGARALALVGCGTFDRAARERLEAVRESRMDGSLRSRVDRLPREIPDPDARLEALGALLVPVYSHDLVTAELEVEGCDARAHHETWQDMMRLQEAGVYPAAFAAIRSPVIMLHGASDPHPGPLIRASLAPYLPQIEYREWEQCGHYPWLERAVRDEFIAFLSDWLLRQFGVAPRPALRRR